MIFHIDAIELFWYIVLLIVIIGFALYFIWLVLRYYVGELIDKIKKRFKKNKEEKNE